MVEVGDDGGGGWLKIGVVLQMVEDRVVAGVGFLLVVWMNIYIFQEDFILIFSLSKSFLIYNLGYTYPFDVEPLHIFSD